MWLSLAVSMRVKAIAMALPPPSEPADIQFFRPMATGLTARSAVLLVSETPGLSFAHFGLLGNGGWRGALRIAQRQAPLRGEGLGELVWDFPAETRVRSFGVVVRAPSGERDAGTVQGREQGLVQQLISQAAVEAFDEGIPAFRARCRTNSAWRSLPRLGPNQQPDKAKPGTVQRGNSWRQKR